MKIAVLISLLALLVNLASGVNPREGYGKFGSEYFPVEEFTKNGGIIRLENGKRKTIRWDDVRIVPSGKAFADVELEMNASEPEYLFNESKIRLGFSIKSNKSAKDLMLLILNRKSDLIAVKIPELVPGETKKLSVKVDISPGLRLIVFDGNKEVQTNIRKPLSHNEASYNLDTGADRDPMKVLSVMPDYRLGSGTARIKVHLNTLGLVTDAEVVESSSRAYGKSAMKAAERWIFIPKVSDSKLIESSVTIPFSVTVN